DQEEAMSISDQIVIMRDGFLQQVASPREMYDDPVNEFVAKFLGNPPINMIKSKSKKGIINIEGLEIEAKGIEDGEIIAGVRPEAFRLDAKSPVQLEVQAFEYFGREILLFVYLEGVLSRVLIDSDFPVEKGEKVGLSLKDGGTLFFDTEGQRIYV
ncbi:MAG: TOBE domain-containing protein, partial [Clostridia bacterium]|nr:TOBE domain-containing protein [Clostridia bacterium]